MTFSISTVVSDVTSDIPTEEQTKSFKLYMAGVSPPVISKLTGLPLDKLNCLIMGANGSGMDKECWSYKRNSIVDEIVVAASVERLDFTLRCTGIASAILHDSLHHLNSQIKDGGRSLTVKEMESVASIIEKLDKIVRLEKGSPTEIVSRAGLSVDEAREILKNDPFAPRTVEAEVVSIPPTPPIPNVDEEDLLG